MIWLVANDRESIELEAPDERSALERGMAQLKEHPKWGNVTAVQKAESREGLKELERRLVVGCGDFFENLGYPDYQGERLLQHVRGLLAS